ncbi:unnamed protein product [Zymoseptoria tritici ST99CH_3D7]|uniref:Uncharacterized protein n=1 Tax=Zymoseptoria tritici (strain ST99CH_3D7) TaxID=1276538 RepID=A0A1X7S8I5_ZYMT9|nr:unnamed protein product [Zymoseptoria tritici ST99CH_3D7]
MVSWATVQSTLLFVGPFLLPKAIQFYRSIRYAPPSQIRPLSSTTSRALTLLFCSAVLALLSTLPLFAPENIFLATSSRLHTTGGVLLTRLAATRTLTAEDQLLRDAFDNGGLPARLLYTRYGPDVLLHNPLASAGEVGAARAFLTYALPTLLIPHLFHIFVLGIATSSLSGTGASRWRVQALVAGLAIPAVEIALLATSDDSANLRSTRYNDIDFLHWKLRVYRGLGITLLDALLGWVIFLSATGRGFLGATMPAGERAHLTMKRLEVVGQKVGGLGVLRNSLVRDRRLGGRAADYWAKEDEVMRSLGEEEEVVRAQREALEGRIDMAKVGKESKNFVDGLWRVFTGEQQQGR